MASSDLEKFEHHTHRKPQPVLPEHKKMYGTARWKRLRLMVLARHPVCQLCHNALAVDVDHIEDHRGDVRLQWCMSNLQSACKACHTRKTHHGG